MSALIDRKYILLFSSRLEQFKQKSGKLFNFKCIYCKDSQKNKKKLRGYLYEKDDGYLYFCHNCNTTKKIRYLLEDHDHHLYTEYVKETFGNSSRDASIELSPLKKSKQIKLNTIFSDLVAISELPKSHKARKYCTDRKIPIDYLDRIYYCIKFKKWTNRHLPNKFDSLDNDSSRIIIPLLDFTGDVIGYIGRSLNPEDTLRYISIILDDSRPKLFGLDRVDLDRDIYVLEGAIDAMCIPNAIASLQGNLLSATHYFSKENLIFIPDRDIRNKEIVQSVRKMIRQNCRICLLPPEFPAKDINDALCKNMPLHQIMAVIKENTFSGLELQLRFATWHKI